MKVLDVPSSGSVAGTTHSRNRFGQYVRTRAIPVNPNSTFQSVVRARMAANSALWRTITPAQRAGWESLSLLETRSDSLGQSYVLNGFGAFVAVNNNRLAAGDSVVLDAPALTVPDAPVLGAIVLSAIAFTAAYTPTPAPTGARIFTYVSPQRSAGRTFEADLRLLQVSAAAAASPVNLLAAYTARFGVPVAGNKVFVALSVYLAGFRSLPALGSAVVV
jgi:hypothetical protein